MLGLRLAFGAIALMAVATAGMGGLALLDDRGLTADAPPLLLKPADDSSYWRAVAAGAEAAAIAHGVELQIEWPREQSLYEVSLGESHACSVDRVGTLCGRHAMNDDVLLAANLKTSSSGERRNVESHRGGITLEVSMADYSAGELCAQTAVEALPRGGKIAVVMEANPGKSSRARFDGFSTFLDQRRLGGNSAASKQIEVVVHHIDRHAAEGLRQISQKVEGQGVQVVIDFTGAAVETLLGAFENADPADRPRIIALDSSDRALEAIELANLYAVVTPDPYQCGYQAVSRVAYLQQRGFMEHPADGRGSILLPPQVVREGTVPEFRASRRDGSQTL